MVEFAIALPVFLLFVLFVLDLARMYRTHFSLDEAASEAAALASTIPELANDELAGGVPKNEAALQAVRTQVKEVVRKSLGQSISDSQIDVNLPTYTTTLADELQNQPIEVVVRLPFKALMAAYNPVTEIEVRALAFREFPSHSTTPYALDCMGNPVTDGSPTHIDDCVCDEDDPLRRPDPVSGACSRCIGDTILAYTPDPENPGLYKTQCSCPTVGMVADGSGSCSCPQGTITYEQVSQQYASYAQDGCYCDPAAITCQGDLVPLIPENGHLISDPENCGCGCPHEAAVSSEDPLSCECDLECAPVETTNYKTGQPVITVYALDPERCRCKTCQGANQFVDGEGLCQCDMETIKPICAASGYIVNPEACSCQTCQSAGFSSYHTSTDGENCVCNASALTTACSAANKPVDLAQCKCGSSCPGQSVLNPTTNQCDCNQAAESLACHNSNRPFNAAQCKCEQACQGESAIDPTSNTCTCDQAAEQLKCHNQNRPFDAGSCSCKPACPGQGSVNTSTNQCDCPISAGDCNANQLFEQENCRCVDCPPGKTVQNGACVCANGLTAADCHAQDLPFDGENCRCGSNCTQPYEFNDSNNRCECALTCSSPKKLDRSNCRCVCDDRHHQKEVQFSGGQSFTICIPNFMCRHTSLCRYDPEIGFHSPE